MANQFSGGRYVSVEGISFSLQDFHKLFTSDGDGNHSVYRLSRQSADERSPGTTRYNLPGFHVAKSVKLENLDKTPTLGEITGVLNQYYMNLQPK